MKDWFIITYFIIGFVYWGINMYARKLPAKNDEQDGWILSPLWLFGWPICFIVLIIYGISQLFGNKNRV